MLNGAAVMDAALLLIAGNEPCPQPQTSEHLAAVEIMQLKNIIILQVRSPTWPLHLATLPSLSKLASKDRAPRSCLSLVSSLFFSTPDDDKSQSFQHGFLRVLAPTGAGC
jgi:hypothetical protein